MDFQNFELEHFQSQFERTVEYNLADSSVKCAGVSDLLAGNDAGELTNLALYYPEVNGTGLLRERIAALYAGAQADNVLVTVGAAQANWMICASLLQPGDEVIVVSPGYRQVWGLAKNIGCVVKETHLRPENNWRLDLDELESLAGSRTKMIAVVNPNNPTGSILSRHEMERVVRICSKTGAWLHADEVYCGTELEGGETPSFWEMYDRVICVNSLSKAYGLAGLRIGWALAAPAIIQDLWRRHEYAVIAAAGPSMKLAEMALEPGKRQMLLDRQKSLSREGHAILAGWVRWQNGRFSVHKATATSIAFVGYHLDMGSVDLANRIREKASVLVAPGAYLGTERHLRITVGYEPEKVRTALGRIGAVVAEMVETVQPAK
ncbi:MAG TPA: aminotransferase class I/II-fold pyridoxal phosphate-dependent enzyme [Candidatus Limnocylindrales bacterium]|nr:aminotransferase class I/II-fold pyridoxal phosphate-dependent enzyme [Candidatus Limnocylindrales bacterium]